MAKIPDFSELTKRFDGLMDSVKSAVAGGPPPKAPEGDEIAAQFVDLLHLTQNVITAHAEQAKVLSTIHQKLGALYSDIQLPKEAQAQAAVEAPKKAPAAPLQNEGSVEPKKEEK